MKIKSIINKQETKVDGDLNNNNHNVKNDILINVIKNNEPNNLELNINPKDAIIVERAFYKYTKLDLEIQNTPIPKKPIWLNIVVRMLRFYQKNISSKLGNRCVFDPSCSHYSEVAYRKKGFLKGTILTIKRLHRCKPENGGIDILK